MTCCIVRLRTQLLLFIFPSVCVCVCVCVYVCVCVFSSKISAQPYKIKKGLVGIHNKNDKLYRGIEKKLCLICSLYLFIFLSFHAFNTNILQKIHEQCSR